MTYDLESDLKEAFSQAASAVSTDSVDRMRDIDYRPRTTRLSPRMRLGAAAGVVATAGAVASAVLLTTASPAYAGWTAAPTTPTRAETASANATCQTQLSSLPGGTASGWSPVVTDVRGPYTLTVYDEAGAYATCLTGPSVTAVSERTASDGSGSILNSGAGGSGAERTASAGSRVFPAGNGVEELSEAHLDSSGHGPYTVVDGQVASDVSAVTLVRSNGTDVQTTTGGGWFVAWWPGNEAASSAQITTPAGTTTQPLS